jgi:DNA-binding IclR family transcriptional regulator
MAEEHDEGGQLVAAPVTQDAPRYPIESVDNAIRLLLLVGRERSISVSAAGKFLGVAPSTAHRLLAMLQHYRLIEQDPALKTYRIGPGLAELGLTALQDFDIRATARPHLSRLVKEVHETAHLVTLNGSDVLFLECVECDAAVRATARTGQRLPAYCTAGGKIQLAQLSEGQVREMFPSTKLKGLTGQSISDRADLLRDLEKARRLGYATNRRESEVDVHAVAAAIVDRTGSVRGAITVSGPPERMPPAALRKIGEKVMAAAAGVAEDIG